MTETFDYEEFEELNSQIDKLKKAQDEVIDRMKVLKNEQRERKKMLEADFSYEIGNIVYQELGRDVKKGDVERFRSFLKKYKDIFRLMMDIENDEVGVDIAYNPTLSEKVYSCLREAAEKEKILTARDISRMLRVSVMDVRKQLFRLMNYGMVKKIDENMFTIV